MRLAPLALVLALLSLPVAAAPYAPPAATAVVTAAAPGRAAQIDFMALEEAVRALAPRASKRPYRFDNTADILAAQRAARELSDALYAANTHLSTDAELLRLVGQWNTLAWRLGYEAAAERAFVHLQAALAAAPDDMQARYLLGGFLTEFDGGADLALPHLERAHQAGLPEATYSLAMVHIQKRELAEAKALLENFAVKTGSTNDPEFRRLLSVLSTGKVQVTSEQLPSLPAVARKS